MPYRHGDVILLDPVKMPRDARKSGNVVAEGEVTGHAHRLTNGSVWESTAGRFVVADGDSVLTHEEHKPLALPGIKEGFGYPIVIQREYDDEHEWRQVAD